MRKALSPHALEELRRISRRGSVPRQDVNAGVSGKFIAEELVDVVLAPSPYPSRKGENVEHLTLSETGLALLSELGA